MGCGSSASRGQVVCIKCRFVFVQCKESVFIQLEQTRESFLSTSVASIFLNINS